MPGEKTRGSGRTRNFATVVYPESAPEGWIDILGEMCIPAFISPLHDQDKNPTGEDKKPHHHVMLMYESVKTREQAMEVFEKIGGVGCEVVQSVRGYARYLCHLDNPEKAQYDSGSVRSLAGADYINIIGLVTDRYKAIAEMMDFIDDNDIHNYSDLLSYCRQEKFEWFRVLCDNGTYVVREYIKSRRFRVEDAC